MEIVGGRDDKVFNEVGNIPEPAKGIPPRGGFFGVGRDCQGKKGQDSQSRNEPFLPAFHRLRLRFFISG